MPSTHARSECLCPCSSLCAHVTRVGGGTGELGSDRRRDRRRNAHWLSLVWAGIRQVVDGSFWSRNGPRGVRRSAVRAHRSRGVRRSRRPQLVHQRDPWTTGAGGALIGLYAGLGFIATAFFSHVLFAGRPPRLYAIDAGYQVFQSVVLGAIIGFLGGGRLG